MSYFIVAILKFSLTNPGPSCNGGGVRWQREAGSKIIGMGQSFPFLVA